MWKYLVALAVVAILAIYVSVQDERSSKQSAYQTTDSDKNASVAKPNEKNTQKNAEHAEGNLPSWYGFFRWPNGTTVWAIILTLIVIADQTRQTAKAAKIAHATFVTQYRPKVIVTRIDLNPASSTEYDRLDDRVWKIELLLFNNGDTTAHVKHCEAAFFLFGDGGKPTTEVERYQSKIWPHFSLAPRERRTFDMPMGGTSGDTLRLTIQILEQAVKSGKPQTSTLICGGTIKYADDNGAIRQTGFRRGWDIRNKRFITYDNPENEYQD
jgi:hypothetical protein